MILTGIGAGVHSDNIEMVRWHSLPHLRVTCIHVFCRARVIIYFNIVKKDEGEGGGRYIGWSISDRTDPVFSVEEDGNIFFLEVVFFPF